jgi:hypothetical protein
MPAKGFNWTAKRRWFCRAFAQNGGHGTNAAIEAGYSKPRAGEEASRLLKYPEIQQQIEKERGYYLSTLGVSDTRIAHELVEMAGMADGCEYDPLDVFERTPGGDMRVKDLEEIPLHMRKAIKKLSFNYNAQGDQSCAVEFYDRQRLLLEFAKEFKVLGSGDGGTVDPESFARKLKELMDGMDQADGLAGAGAAGEPVTH